MNTKEKKEKPAWLQAIGGDKLVLILAIVLVFVLFTALNKNFLSTTNLVNILVAASLVGMVAVGHTYLIIAKQNDLSPGSLAALSGVVVALLLQKGLPIPVAILITLLVGALVGLFNAWMVNAINIEAFIATLVTQMIVRGLAYILCGGKPVAISNQAFNNIGKLRILNIPFSVWLMVLCLLVFGFILSKTKFGRSVYAIGGSTEAARLAGLNPQRIIRICFIIIGMLTAMGGVVFASRMNAGQPAANVNLEFDAITAVVLGGTSFTGGVGDMFGTVLGIILIQSFNTGLTMVNVSSFWQYVARGALLLFALTSDFLRKKKREKELLQASMQHA